MPAHFAIDSSLLQTGRHITPALFPPRRAPAHRTCVVSIAGVLKVQRALKRLTTRTRFCFCKNTTENLWPWPQPACLFVVLGMVDRCLCYAVM